MAEPIETPVSDPDALELPNPLVLQNGAPVKTRAEWIEKRAPELKELFQRYEYGFLPPAPQKVDAKLVREDSGTFGGKATLRELTLSWGMEGVEIHLLLVIPNHREKPVPAFLGLNFHGNHALVKDPLVRAPDLVNYLDPLHQNLEAQRGKEVDAWNIEQTIDRGYALATFFCGDIVPDDPAAARERLSKFRPADRAGAPRPDDCATVGAWAWGLMRAVDYLAGDPAIDGKKIAVVGHSRLGKTAIVVAAFDERIAMAIPLQAGCGGTAPSRIIQASARGSNGKPAAEDLKHINGSFPHWFDETFKQFNDSPEKLPIDQHELIALCAPRPVLICAASEDLWANPSGQMEMVRAADPVYRLVAGEGLTKSETPPLGQLQLSRLSYFIRPGKHSMSKVDWDAFLDFADYFFH